MEQVGCGREAIVPIALLHTVGACGCHEECLVDCRTDPEHRNHDHFQALLRLTHDWYDSHWAKEPWVAIPHFVRSVYRDLEFGVDMENNVTLVFHPDRQTAQQVGQVTPGVMPDLVLDLESYNKAMVQTRESIGEVRTRLKAEHTDWTSEQVEAGVNDFTLERIKECEEFMKVKKLNWIMYWRVLEESLKTQSEAEKTRVRNIDKVRRNVATGTHKPLKERIKAKAEPVIQAGLSKEENAIRILMQRLGLTEQEAKDRLRIKTALDAGAVVAPPPPPDEEVK